MRTYETTFILNPQVDDAAIDRQVTAVLDLIKNDGGEIIHENRIGTRRLAYPIQGLIQGFYTSVVFKANTSVLPILERHFKLEEPYIRYLTIRYEGDIEKLTQGGNEEEREMVDKPKAAEEKPEAKPEAKTEAETAPKAESAPAEPAPAAETTPEPSEPDTVTPEPADEKPAADTSEPLPEDDEL